MNQVVLMKQLLHNCICTNRFDEATRLAFIDLFDKVSNNKETSAPKPSESEVASAVVNQPQTVTA